MSNRAKNSQGRSFQKTLNRISLLNLISAMLVTWLLLSVTAVMTLRQYEQNNLKLQALSLSHNLEAAIVFNDKQAIDEILAESGRENMFSFAEVLDNQGHVISRWNVDNAQNSLFLNLLQPKALIHRVYHNQQVIGEIHITAATVLLRHFLWKSLAVLTLSLFVISIMSFLLSRHLHNGLVAALQMITDVLHDVRKNRNLGRRISADSIHGLHMFAKDFNKLLDEIQQWQIQLNHENASLWKSVRHDELTSLANRSVFRDTISEIIRQKDSRSALLFMDGNKFKAINDTYGHASGDMVLVEVARRLETFAGHQHVAFRLNGDEFAMLLNDVSSRHEVENIISVLHDLMRKPVSVNHDTYISFSLSIGYAMTSDVHSAEALFEMADRNMYSNKAAIQEGNK